MVERRRKIVSADGLRDSVRSGAYEAAASNLYMFYRLVFAVVCPGETFSGAWHFSALCRAYQQFESGEIPRQLVCVPPRHGKSLLASVVLVAWILGRRPGAKIICGSYADALGLDFARRTRNLLESDIYRSVFPSTELRSGALEELTTTAGGYRLTTSVMGSLTGKGADFIIVDDPIKAAEASSAAARDTAYHWFKNSLMSRFDKPNQARAMVVMQRLHGDDLVGRLLAESVWRPLIMPGEAWRRESYDLADGSVQVQEPGDLLFPERFDRDVLAQRRLDLTDAGFEAQILQRPAPPGGNLFAMSKVKYDSEVRSWREFEGVVASVDTGVSTDPKCDYTAVTIWGVLGSDCHLLDVKRGRWTLPQQVSQVAAIASKVQCVLIERAGSGIQLAQVLSSQGVNNMLGFNPRLDKETRAQQVALMIERGRVHLPPQADWIDMFIDEMAAFPHGRNDDMVDTASQFFMQLTAGFPPALRLSAYKGNTPMVEGRYVSKRRLVEYS